MQAVNTWSLLQSQGFAAGKSCLRNSQYLTGMTSLACKSAVRDAAALEKNYGA
jgi:hypothetical protein